MRITVDAVMALKPCYARANVEALFAGRASVTPADIAVADSVPPHDRAWVLLRLAPREVWMPAVYRSAERAIRNASWVLHRVGLEEESQRLEHLPPVVDAVSARTAAAAAAASAASAAYAASASSAAAYADAAAAADAAASADAYADAYAPSRAAEWTLFLADVASLVEAGAPLEVGRG